MIIVSDTSAITSLLQIHQAELLSRLYREVIIPFEVATELKKFHADIPGFIRVLSVSDHERFRKLCAELDEGEAAAITLMLEGRGDLLLIDERRGRKIAERERLPVIGVIGVLLEARLQQLIPSLAAVIEELEQAADFRISTKLKQRALEVSGESPAN